MSSEEINLMYKLQVLQDRVSDEEIKAEIKEMLEEIENNIFEEEE